MTWINSKKELPPIGQTVIALDRYGRLFRKKRYSTTTHLWNGSKPWERKYFFWQQLPDMARLDWRDE